jgi:hypothetical protein
MPSVRIPVNGMNLLDDQMFRRGSTSMLIHTWGIAKTNLQENQLQITGFLQIKNQQKPNQNLNSMNCR